MASIIIRDALLSDLDTCATIERSASKRFLQAEHAELRAVADDDQTLSLKTLENAINAELCFISEINHQSVGFIALTQFENSWYIEEICVAEHAQSQGVGNALLAYIKMLAEIRRIPSINLITFRDIAWNQGFYTKNGYISMAEPRLSAQFLTLWQRDNQHFTPNLRVCMQLKINIDKF